MLAWLADSNYAYKHIKKPLALPCCGNKAPPLLGVVGRLVHQTGLGNKKIHPTRKK